jgi:hypothetical protein
VGRNIISIGKLGRQKGISTGTGHFFAPADAVLKRIISAVVRRM